MGVARSWPARLGVAYKAVLSVMTACSLCYSSYACKRGRCSRLGVSALTSILAAGRHLDVNLPPCSQPLPRPGPHRARHMTSLVPRPHPPRGGTSIDNIAAAILYKVQLISEHVSTTHTNFSAIVHVILCIQTKGHNKSMASTLIVKV